MRVLIAGFQHETNTFAASAADWEAFGRGDFFPPFLRGEVMLARTSEGGLPTAGFLRRAGAAGWEVVPSCWAGASPSGPVTRDAFDRIVAAILEHLAAALTAGPLDGIYLDLHGAAVCEHLDAPETTLLRAIRSIVGGDLPLVASLDLHANVDETLLQEADYMVAYRTYPHIDMTETGSLAFELLERRMQMGRRERLVARRIPFLLPIVAQSTLADPAASTYRLLGGLERLHGGTPSFAMGFPAADVPHCGPTLWAYGEHADLIIDALYDHVVGTREQWLPRFLDAPSAVAQAMSLAEGSEGSVIIADVQDNPGAGADGNTTGLLRALLKAGAGVRWPGRIAIGLVNDPGAATAAANAGVGGSIETTVGSQGHTWAGTPTEPAVRGRFLVRALHDGAVRLGGPMMHGAPVEAGPSACLELEGILIAVCSARTQMLDRMLFRMVGIEPSAMKIIVVKSAVHFHADFDQIAFAHVAAKAPGPMAADPRELPWRRLRSDVSPGA